MRSIFCGEVNTSHVDQEVTLCGWVNRRRDLGAVIFVDLRDREGIVQVVFDPDLQEVLATANTLRNEFCVQIKGKVRARPETQINKDMNLAGINHKIETNSVPNILCDDLLKIIFNLLHNNDPKLQNFLYRVDIPEKHNVEIQNDNIRIRSQKLSIIILKKECQKLWFKSRN